MIIRVCCKCEKVLGKIDDGKPISVKSHTYCEPCAKAEIETIENFFNNVLPNVTAEGMVANG